MNKETSGEALRSDLMNLLSQYFLDKENTMLQHFTVLAKGIDTESSEAEFWMVESPGLNKTDSLGMIEYAKMQEYTNHFREMIQNDESSN